MIVELKRKMDRLLRTYRAGQPLALLFDYDGTLVPIVEHPTLARLTPHRRGLLQRLAEQPRLIVGVLLLEGHIVCGTAL